MIDTKNMTDLFFFFQTPFSSQRQVKTASLWWIIVTKTLKSQIVNESHARIIARLRTQTDFSVLFHATEKSGHWLLRTNDFK